MYGNQTNDSNRVYIYYNVFITIWSIFCNRLNNDIHIKLTDKAKDYLVDAGYDVNYGARPLKREVSKTIESLLAHELVKGTIKYGEAVTFDVVDNELIIEK